MSYPLAPSRGGRVQGVGSVSSGVIESRSRALINTGFGVLRLDLTDLAYPRILSGQEA